MPPRGALLPDRPKGGSLKTLLPLWGYLKPYRGRAFWAGVALLISSGTVLGIGAGLRQLVDKGFSTGNAGLLDGAVTVLLAVVAMMAVATAFRFYLVTWIGERMIADLRRDVFARVLTLDAAFFEGTRTSEVTSRITTDTAIVQVVLDSSVSMVLRNSVLLIGGTVMLMVTSLKLTLLVFLVVPLVLVPIIVFGRKVRGLSRAAQDRIADLGVHVDESVGAVRTVQAYTHETIEAERFSTRTDAAFSAATNRVRARAMMVGSVIFLIFSAISVILWIGGHDVISGKISAGELSAFVFYAALVASGVGAISEVLGELQRAAGASERLFELLAMRPGIAAPAIAVPLPTPPTGAVTLEDVSFRYPTRLDRLALEHLDLTVAPGERVAVVGPSGAGKTTLFQLLLRFYDPEAGRITFDGVDLRQADPAALRSRIGLVAQDPMIFAASALDNIRYGRPDASDEEVRAAAESAFATEFIERLPDGFGSYLGERGVRLSGGQRQRIAIARAILRNPALLLLDEATSALDAESERAVQQALDRLMVDRTTLIIAHRLATVTSADRIIVLDRGKIVAQGKHADLVRQGGLYARLASLQFEQAANGFEEVRAG